MKKDTLRDADPSVVCPECGGDVCTLRDTRKGWRHRSQVIPRVVWVIVFLGLIGYWVSIGQWSYATGQTSLFGGGAHQAAGGSVGTSLFPPGMQEEAVYVSTRELRDAIDGDKQALDAVVVKLSESVDRSDAGQARLRVESVLFGLKEPYGANGSNLMYRFGGTLMGVSESTMVQDLRDPESIEQNMYQGTWGDGGWHLFPSLGHSRITQGGAVIHSWNVHLLNVFGVLSACMVVALLARRLCLVCRVPVARKWGFAAVLALVMFVSALFVGSLNKMDSSYQLSHAYQDIAQSLAYPIDQLRAAVLEPSKALDICEELLDLVPAGQEGDLLLSQAWTYTPATGKKWARPVTDRLFVSIGYSFHLLHADRRMFREVQEGEEIPVRRQSFWQGIRDYGMASVQWGKPESQKSVSIGVFNLVSIGAFFWLIWSAFHWCSRMVLWLLQRRRVREFRCIFCAYQLTMEGKRARSLSLGS